MNDLNKWPLTELDPLPLRRGSINIDFGHDPELRKRQRAVYDRMRKARTHTYDSTPAGGSFRYFKGG